MSDRIKADSETYKKHNIDICYDTSPESPREWSNLCVVHISHSNYAFGDVNHNSRESIREAEAEARRNGDKILPLYMYDHSGITISLSPFSCRWDSGQVGVVIIPRKTLLTEFSRKRMSQALWENGMRSAKAEVANLDQYIRGDVYGYVISEMDGEDVGEEVDSCWGFYGETKEVMQEAKAVVDSITEKEDSPDEQKTVKV